MWGNSSVSRSITHFSIKTHKHIRHGIAKLRIGWH
jgi:hypothetical protein